MGPQCRKRDPTLASLVPQGGPARDQKAGIKTVEFEEKSIEEKRKRKISDDLTRQVARRISILFLFAPKFSIGPIVYVTEVTQKL